MIERRIATGAACERVWRALNDKGWGMVLDQIVKDIETDTYD